MDLSIVIVSYKTRDLLNECLESLGEREQSIEFEIIVIDNNSQDGSVEILRRKYPQVRLIENKQNFGFGRACNQGISIARGKYFFILNPDTIIGTNTLIKIISFMDSNPRIGIGGCYVFSPNGKLQTSFYKFPTLLSYFSRMISLFRILPNNRLTNSFFWEYPYRDSNIAISVDRVLGGVMVLRGETIEQIGLFDETYFLYAEELDLCYRARQKGWEISTIPDTYIVHYHQQSTSQNFRETTYHIFRSDFLFFKKFYPPFKVILLRLMQFFAILLRTLTWCVVYILGFSKKSIAREKLYGYIRLLFSNYDYSKSLLR